MKKFTLPALLILLITFAFFLEFLNAEIASENIISGEVRQGYRVLQIPAEQQPLEFTVFRGDYIKFAFSEGVQEAQIVIPDLGINQKLTGNLGTTTFIKMKKTGRFAFTLGSRSGQIEVIEYKGAQYQALTVAETRKLISELSPFILDVRTPFEYANGHLQGAKLIPVQELQQRFQELEEYKNENILIYCATGNRSTVASKILIDNGFTRIYNMRSGIHVWEKNGYPVVH